MTGWQVLLLPLVIDVVTCNLGIVGNRRPAPSGLPLITLPWYGYAIFWISEHWPGFLLAMSIAVLDALLVFAIPAMDHRLLRRPR